MKKLGQIPAITTRIKSASFKTIKVLHILISGNKGDTSNRKKLMEFKGFLFSEELDELAVKIKQVSQQLNEDVVSICDILAIEYSGTK